ncbi:MAG TPA: TetR/AcrR family transcriptional regulator [Terracidiphilus sp.]|nr:TetR/AcrR family transcriptional regulator [Terracidiphilus sp.]
MARPRSSEAHQKVLRAALALFCERGIEATSMDAIARASGVSKATIYNHWHDRDALLMEVMEMIHGLDRTPEEFDSGDLLTDLTWILTRKPPGEFEAERTRLTASMIAYSKLHAEFGKAWRSRVMEPARNAIKKALCRGIERGDLSPALDFNLAEAMLLGPMVYSRIFQSERNASDPEIGPKVAEAVVRAYSISGGRFPRHTQSKSAR